MPQNPAGAVQPGAGVARLSRRGVNSVSGRYQAPELFFQQPFAALTSPVIPRSLNLARPLDSIKIVWRGRVVIATANFTSVACEAPQNILQRIRLSGTHARFNQLVPIDISGATAFAWARLFQVRGSTLLINGTRQAELGVPLTQIGATFGNTGTYDLEIHYDIPLGPMFGPHARIPALPFLYFPQDWADTLQLQLFFADATAFGVPGTAVTTFTAFGSGVGVPSVNVYLNYAILGPLANAIQGAVVIRNEQNLSGGVVGAIANQQRIQILQKQKTLNVLVKSGTLVTGQSAGVSSYATLVDNMLDRTTILLDNKPVRNNQSNPTAKEYAGRMFNTVMPGGYFLHTFVDSQNPLTLYRGDQVAGGSTFELDSDVLTAAPQQAVSIVQEQVFGRWGARAG